MIKQLLEKRALPPLKSREEMLEILQREEYGYLPNLPEAISYRVERAEGKEFCAGKATLDKVEITVTLGGGDFTFPVYAAIPTAQGKHPFFVCVNFRDCVPDMYIPTEEIIDSGYAVLSFCYKDVTSDDGDFTNGLAGLIYPDGVRSEHSAGKIAMWAWAMQRVMDYAVTNAALDTSCAIACGHSRLGKTALFAAATDTRFAFAFSNNSGCSGAAITRDKAGERVANITKVFPFWFCESYKRYAGAEDKMPFDQHYLAASIAPRFVYVSSAALDEWADPLSEMLCCVAISEEYERQGAVGFVCEDREPRIGDTYHAGSVGYHLRAGRHYLGREDWQKVIAFVNKHR